MGEAQDRPLSSLSPSALPISLALRTHGTGKGDPGMSQFGRGYDQEMKLEFSSVENIFTCGQDARLPTTHSSQGSSVCAKRPLMVSGAFVLPCCP